MTSSIRFAHLADLHLGAWREKRLTNLNFKTFKRAIDKVIEEKVDFAIFAGDIFNNAMPPIDIVNRVAEQLMRLKEEGIPLYVIGGSHDYSNTGKSFLQLLDTTGLFVDVSKVEYVDKDKINLSFSKDKSGAVLSGVLGKKKGLDKNIYKNLSEHTVSKNNFNIFLFHCTLDDFKPDFMKMVDVDINSSFLPKGFDYYAGGHVHTHIDGRYDTGRLSYPGPLFPNNFSEMKRERPSFNLCEFNFEDRKTDIKRVFINTYQKEHIKIEINNLNPFEAREKIENTLEKLDIKDKIVLVEVSGIIEGKVSEVGMSQIISKLYDKGAFHVLKNTYKLSSSQVKAIDHDISEDSVDIESEIIESYLKDSQNKNIEARLIKRLLGLQLEKLEGEKVAQYQDRVAEALEKSLNTK